MNRRSFIATLLAAPLALLGWKRAPSPIISHPKPIEFGVMSLPPYRIVAGSPSVTYDVYDSGLKLAEGRDYELIDDGRYIRFLSVSVPGPSIAFEE